MSGQDVFHAPDYFALDELLSDEHKMVRDSVRD
jgi:glutaryl-CoA dehydrogenase